MIMVPRASLPNVRGPDVTPDVFRGGGLPEYGSTARAPHALEHD